MWNPSGKPLFSSAWVLTQADSILWSGPARAGGLGPPGLSAVTKPITVQIIAHVEVLSYLPYVQVKCQQPVERPDSAQVSNQQAIKSNCWEPSPGDPLPHFWSSTSQIGRNANTQVAGAGKWHVQVLLNKRGAANSLLEDKAVNGSARLRASPPSPAQPTRGRGHVHRTCATG